MYKHSPSRMLREILKDPERKSLAVIARDIIVLAFKFRELPVHYFSRYLYKYGVNNIKDYIPNGLLGQIAPYFNDITVKQVLDNKLYFSLYYSQFGIKMPKILAFNHKNLFASGGKTEEISNVHKFRAYLIDLLKQVPGCDSLFLKKIYSSSSGKNIYIITADQVEKENSELNEVFSDVVLSEFVFQEKVKQHPELNRLNSSSLNTMRIDTFIDRDGNIEIISGFLKMSTNGLAVDNISSGGCGVGIDMKSGKLRKNGYSKLRFGSVSILTEHPLSGVRFEGFSVPMLDEARDLVLGAAKLMPGLRLVGWDVGFAEDGPVLIEGNSDYGINSNDHMYGGYMANETFRKVLTEFKSR